FGRWIYGLHHTWQRLKRSDTGSRSLSWWLLGWFLDRYPPYLEAATLAWCRRHEHDADALAAAHRPGFARTLVRPGVLGDRLEHAFWPEQLRAAAQDPVPPADVLARMGAFAAAPVPEADTARWARHELAVKTNLHAAHPTLRERIAHLGRGACLTDP